ncbi:DUF86 domain-containing protein [Candidatus Poribacteria bacterium]|nr:DUF86 domain-containing protein [Candidatus Poribacteria bacterium]
MYDMEKIKRIRDIISHHYFDVDAEVIFDICKNHISPLAKTINLIAENIHSKNRG